MITFDSKVYSHIIHFTVYPQCIVPISIVSLLIQQQQLGNNVFNNYFLIYQQLGILYNLFLTLNNKLTLIIFFFNKWALYSSHTSEWLILLILFPEDVPNKHVTVCLITAIFFRFYTFLNLF